MPEGNDRGDEDQTMPEPSMRTVDHPADRTEQTPDPLRPARGVMRAVLAGAVLWIAILLGLFLLWHHHG